MEKREIKFRAWDSAKKYWLTNADTVYLSDEGNCYTLKSTNYSGDYLSNESVEVNMYTGLKDKNGRGVAELYEGDVISETGEKIGNIYENENLLEGKSNIVIEKIGTKSWRITEEKAMARGYGYAF